MPRLLDEASGSGNGIQLGSRFLLPGRSQNKKEPPWGAASRRRSVGALFYCRAASKIKALHRLHAQRFGNPIASAPAMLPSSAFNRLKLTST